MKRSTAKLLQIVNIIVMSVLMLVCAVTGWKAGMYLVLAGAVVINMVLNHCLRCKACGRWPRRGYFLDLYCPRCGTPYDD